MTKMFSWCYEGRHDTCHRSYERYYIDPKTNKPVFTGETVKCECPKRGCPCYVKAIDRTKKKTRRKAK